jgi:hypothetical protein
MQDVLFFGLVAFFIVFGIATLAAALTEEY